MTDPTVATLLTRFADAIDTTDWDALRALLHPAAGVTYSTTGEQFTAEQFVRLNSRYPGSWRFVAEDVVDGGETGALRARVSARDHDGDDNGGSDGSDDEAYVVTTFATVRDGLLHTLVETWAQTGPPPSSERRPDLG